MAIAPAHCRAWMWRAAVSSSAETLRGFCSRKRLSTLPAASFWPEYCSASINRIAAGSVPVWQVGLAVLLMLLAIVVLVRVAARLYEGAVLRTGAKVGWREAWQGTGR